MKLQVHSIHFDADRKLVNFIQKKIDKLERFYDRLMDGEVFLRLNNEGVENKTVEIKLNMPGTQLFAAEKARSFEAAADMATQALRMQIKNSKPNKERTGLNPSGQIPDFIAKRAPLWSPFYFLLQRRLMTNRTLS
jgi:ribosomal subunit interface protein